MKLTTSGILLSSFDPNDFTMRDLAFDGFNIWAINLAGDVWKFTTSGELIDSIVGFLKSGWGLTYGDESLWASDPYEDMIYQIALSSGIEEETEVRNQMSDISLLQNQPNPFYSTTVIRYSCQLPTHVSLKVYDLTGMLVKSLYEGEVAAGEHELRLDADDLTAGVYFYRLAAGFFSTTKKMIVLSEWH